MSDTKLTYELDGSGRIMVKATNQGVLLTKEEAECVAAHIAKQRERIAELEELVRDWQVLYENPDLSGYTRLRNRTLNLGIGVIDE